MALTDLWMSAREQIEDKQIHQIIAFAGSGRLADGNEASREFRQFLSQVPSGHLARYANECLTDKFEGSGFALQDIINEAGRRLEFEVQNGRYRGTSGDAIGFDGLWRSPDGHTIVAEVKTTDAYRIDLNTVAGYRRAIIKAGGATEDQSSILMVVGRQDTGDLEAQIRGSRYAWDIRLISVDALFHLLSLKEEVGDPSTLRKVRDILIPREYTKLDSIIDIMFSTARMSGQMTQVVGSAVGDENGVDADTEPTVTRLAPAGFHSACVARIQKVVGKPLVKKSRTGYLSPDGTVALYCLVSAERQKGGTSFFWFAFYPYQREQLQALGEAYLALGCGSEQTILLVPFSEMAPWVETLWTTERNGSLYWHVQIYVEDDRYMLHRKRAYPRLDLTQHLLR